MCNVLKRHFLTVSHMENSTIILFLSVIGAVSLLSIVSTLFVGIALKALGRRQDATAEQVLVKSTPKQLEAANAAAQSAQQIVMTTCQELAKYKDQIHGEMQRFYAIMSRNEKAVKKIEQPSGSPPADAEPPDEISASAFDTKPDAPPGHDISKAELRAMARKAGL